METGDTLMVEDLPFPEGVTPVFKKAFKVLEISQAKAERGDEAEEAVEADA
jgi:hypothetical protein